MRNIQGLIVLLVAGAMAGPGHAAGGPAGVERTVAAAEASDPPADEQASPPASDFELRDNSQTLKYMLRNPSVSRFLKLWGTNNRGLFINTWFGIPTIQNPFDVWITQEILYEVKPDFVVETGTYRGGSAALWATLLEQINPGARVITIDVTDVTEEARALPIVQKRVDFLVGSSTDPAIVAEVKERVAGGKVLVILDSLHTKDHVLAELNAYSPLVDVGSYLIVQDTGMAVPTRKEKGWANLAVDAFLASHDEFEVDRERERLIVTSNPGGFLKRIR